MSRPCTSIESGAFSEASLVESAVADFVGADDFPCVGAKAALSQEQLRVVVAGDLRSGAADVALVTRLQAFAAQAGDDDVFLSFMVVFEGTPLLPEAAFEQALWTRLQALHEIDARRYRWDACVSSDPRAPTFSMSFGGRGFYIIGLHPGASRMARRFGQAALVFNLHSQFETLRRDGRYDKLREAITGRDIALCGSANPMLAAHGVTSEAPQYSGRRVGDDWVCPFHARPVSVP